MNPPAGWNPDPVDPTIDRYWDGRQWTAQTRPKIQDDPTQVFATSAMAEAPGVDSVEPEGKKRRKWPWIAGAAVAAVVAVATTTGGDKSEESTTPAVSSSVTASATAKPTTTAKAPTVTTTTTLAPAVTTTVAVVPLVPQVQPTTTTPYVPPKTTEPAYVPPMTTEPAYIPRVDIPNPSVKYSSCAEAKAAGVAPIHKGEPGYSTKLDADKDGIACDK